MIIILKSILVIILRPKQLNVIRLWKKYDTKDYGSENDEQSTSSRCEWEYFGRLLFPNKKETRTRVSY